MVTPEPERISLKNFVVLGAFNSGTGFIHSCLALNRFQPAPSHLQIDLFKHYPAPILAWMATRDSVKEEVGGLHWIVVVRDPVSWLAAMWKASYELQFIDSSGPVAWSLHSSNHGVTYQQRFQDIGLPEVIQNTSFTFTSLLDLWEKLYCGWVDWLMVTGYSFSIVKYEDLLQSPAESLCELGRAMNHELGNVLHIPLSPSKEHGDPCGFVQARHKLVASRVARDQRLTLSSGDVARASRLRQRFGYTTDSPPLVGAPNGVSNRVWEWIGQYMARATITHGMPKEAFGKAVLNK